MSRRTINALLRPDLREESGQSLVEFAVILPLVVMVVLVLVDFGRALNMYLQAAHVANEGARLAAVDYAPPGGLTLANYIQQQILYGELQTGSTTNAGAQGKARVCISFPGPNTGLSGAPERGNPVRVEVSSNYNWIPGGLLPGSVPIAGAATMRLEQDPDPVVLAAGCST